MKRQAGALDDGLPVGARLNRTTSHLLAPLAATVTKSAARHASYTWSSSSTEDLVTHMAAAPAAVDIVVRRGAGQR